MYTIVSKNGFIQMDIQSVHTQDNILALEEYSSSENRDNSENNMDNPESSENLGNLGNLEVVRVQVSGC